MQFLQVSTPLASQVLFLSPLQAMSKFRLEGTGDASALPYAAMVVNSAAWCFYGALASPAPDLTILLSNVGGVVFGLYYCATFLRHMSTGSDAPQLFVGALAVVGAILAAAAQLPAESAHEVIGYAGVSFSVLMFSGPLASVQAILRDCSATSLPLGFTFATVLNCAPPRERIEKLPTACSSLSPAGILTLLLQVRFGAPTGCLLYTTRSSVSTSGPEPARLRVFESDFALLFSQGVRMLPASSRRQCSSACTPSSARTRRVAPCTIESIEAGRLTKRNYTDFFTPTGDRSISQGLRQLFS